jgi:hypothetical protein
LPLLPSLVLLAVAWLCLPLLALLSAAWRCGLAPHQAGFAETLRLAIQI